MSLDKILAIGLFNAMLDGINKYLNDHAQYTEKYTKIKAKADKVISELQSEGYMEEKYTSDDPACALVITSSLVDDKTLSAVDAILFAFFVGRMTADREAQTVQQQGVKQQDLKKDVKKESAPPKAKRGKTITK